MNRGQIRIYIRGLIDEYTELPEGLIKDESTTELDLNEIINTSKDNVYLDLIGIAPWLFRKSFKITTTALKRTYSLTELSVADLFKIEGIFWNIAGSRPKPLFYVEPEQLPEFIYSGESGDPKVWGWDEKEIIAIDPKPTSSIVDCFKAFYFPIIPDLNDDALHTPPTKYSIPDLPKLAHLLIALDAVIELHIIGEEESADVAARYKARLDKIRERLETRQGVTPPIGMSLKELYEL